MVDAPHDTPRFASALSDEEPVGDALDEVLGEIGQSLGDGPVDLAVVFVTPHHRREFDRIAEEISRRLSSRVAIGVTAAGVVGTGAEIEKRAGLSVLAARLPGTWLSPFTYEQLNWPEDADDPAALRRAMLGENHAGEDPAAILLFPDPFSTPMVKLLPAMNAAMPGVPIVGGLASGSRETGGNRLMIGGTVMHEGAVGVAIGGAIRVDCFVSQGCRPIGQPWIITKAQNNIIQEIGRRPVLAAIQEMADALEEVDRAAIEGGLLMGRVISEFRDSDARDDFLIRNIIGADRDSGYIAVADLVRVGQTIQFHVRDAESAAQQFDALLAEQAELGGAAGMLLCTCNGRGSSMFNTPNFETGTVRRHLGDVPLAGLFAAGEIGPIGRENFLHGFSASVAVFRRT